MCVREYSTYIFILIKHLSDILRTRKQILSTETKQSAMYKSTNSIIVNFARTNRRTFAVCNFYQFRFVQFSYSV